MEIIELSNNKLWLEISMLARQIEKIGVNIKLNEQLGMKIKVNKSELDKLYQTIVEKLTKILTSTEINIKKLKKQYPETVKRRGKTGFDYTVADSHGHDAYCWNVRDTRVAETKRDYLILMINAAKKHQFIQLKRYWKQMEKEIQKYRDEDFKKR